MYFRNKNSLYINSFIEIGDKVYFSDGNYNVLVVYDKLARKIKKIEKFPDIEKMMPCYHRGCMEHNNRIFFIPDKGQIFHIYDITNDVIETKELNIRLFQENSYGVQFAYKYRNKIWLFPYYQEHQLKSVNLDDFNDIRTEEWWNSGIESVSIRSGEFEDGIIWSQCVGTNKLFITDLNNFTIDEYTIEIEKKNVWEIEYDRKNFWITVNDTGCIYRYELSGKYEKFNVINTLQSEISPIRIVICTEQFVFFLLREKDELYFIDKKSGRVKFLLEFSNEIDIPLNAWTVYMQIEKNNLYMFCSQTNLIVKIDLETLKAEFVFSEIKDKSYDSILKLLRKESMCNRIIMEEIQGDWRNSLSAFINILSEV